MRLLRPCLIVSLAAAFCLLAASAANVTDTDGLRYCVSFDLKCWIGNPSGCAENQYPEKQLTQLGSDEKLIWAQTAEALMIEAPKSAPNDIAVVFRITPHNQASPDLSQ